MLGLDLGLFYSYFKGKNSESKPSCVYGDDLNKKPAAEKEEAEPLLEREGGEKNREGVKVKVLMTKEEAARLLSKCKYGGMLEFGDVAQELGNIPASRVVVVPAGSGRDGMFQSTHEELSP
ncbi:hypothetical protein NMG60_11030551 [Bertholletia excelsa]